MASVKAECTSCIGKGWKVAADAKHRSTCGGSGVRPRDHDKDCMHCKGKGYELTMCDYCTNGKRRWACRDEYHTS